VLVITVFEVTLAFLFGMLVCTLLLVVRAFGIALLLEMLPWKLLVTAVLWVVLLLVMLL